MKSRRAKVLHLLGGKPLIGYPLSILRELGIDPIVVVVGHQQQAVRAACAPYGVQFVAQEEQRGTGHAVRMAASALRKFRGDLLLVNGDLPLLRRESYAGLVRTHGRKQAAVSLLTAVVDDPGGFGRIVRSPAGKRRDITAIVEHKDATPEQLAIREVNVGLYCADALFLFAAIKELRPSPVTKEYYLTDVIASAVRRGRPIGDFQAQPIEGTQISTRTDLAAVEQMQREHIAARWLEQGVTIEDPDTAYIGPDVKIGQDAILGPNTVLRGKTIIGAECRIEGSAWIVDSVLGERVHVRPGVMMTEAKIASEAILGPFAQLRPGTVLGRGVHIGNFVETKQAVIGDGTKANHLAYIGDAEVGEQTNIGAGTITCNYDGFRKHKTTIGARVQVGSDTQLVAPITIGDDAYISTGSTVRQDVSPGALYFNPKREMERPGWVAARREKEASSPPPRRRSRAK